MSDLPAALHMQHNFNNEVLDQGVFDFIDSLVDVPLDELVCDLEAPFLPSSVPADSSETPAQHSQVIGNESHGQQSVPQIERNRSEHDRELGRRSQRRFRAKKKVQYMTQSSRAQAALLTVPTDMPAPVSLMSTIKQ